MGNRLDAIVHSRPFSFVSKSDSVVSNTMEHMIRLSVALRECFHVELSQGTIDNILVAMQQASDEMYEQIRCRITLSPVVSANETDAIVESKLRIGKAYPEKTCSKDWMICSMNKTILSFIFHTVSFQKIEPNILFIRFKYVFCIEKNATFVFLNLMIKTLKP